MKFKENKPSEKILDMSICDKCKREDRDRYDRCHDNDSCCADWLEINGLEF